MSIKHYLSRRNIALFSVMREVKVAVSLILDELRRG